MRDAQLYSLASEQHNRFSRAQLEERGWTGKAIRHRVECGRIVAVHQGVFALPPVFHSDLSVWKGVTLTAPDTSLNRLSAACAWGVLGRRPTFETVVRPGKGGARWLGGILVYRSQTLDGETTTHEGIPITTVPRTLLDLALFVSEKALAKAIRDAIRLERTSMRELGDYLGRCRGRKGSVRLSKTLARYHGLPLERARSGAEIRALEILRDANRPMPRLNVKIADQEGDLVWIRQRLIVEIDGAPYHQDKGADARKETAWRSAGFDVKRVSSDDIYEHPLALLALAPAQVSPKGPPRGQ